MIYEMEEANAPFEKFSSCKVDFLVVVIAHVLVYCVKSIKAYNVHSSQTISNEISGFLFPVQDVSAGLATT